MPISYLPQKKELSFRHMQVQLPRDGARHTCSLVCPRHVCTMWHKSVNLFSVSVCETSF